MDLDIQYIKKRKDFGRQPDFHMIQPQMLDSINTEKFDQRSYCLRNPVHQFTQATTSQSSHCINTIRVSYKDTGMNHTEGGWPKEVNHEDEEQTSRICKRVEREPDYINAVNHNFPKFERFIKQNNNIAMYQMYYKDLPPVPPVEKYSMRINNSHSDSANRPVSCLAWTIENNPKIIASYCDKTFPMNCPKNKIFTGFIWDLENMEPESEFEPPTACWQLAASPNSPKMIIGGLENGTVCVFDVRTQTEPVTISPIHFAHRDPITSLLNIQSRTNTEFFTGATDGVCKWWDVRNLTTPIEHIIVSVRVPPGENINISNSEGVSCLQYDRAMPTRYLCGTDTGLVVNVNKKGKTDREMFTTIFYAHDGPVKAVQRSPCTSKMFLTCGNWSVHVWSDEVPSSPIITGTAQQKQINDAVWAPYRVSSYMTVGADGMLRYWDLLRKYREPVLNLFLSKRPLLKIKPNEYGNLVAVGDAAGFVYILSLSDNLVESSSNDKQLMIQIYERELHREQILSNRVKEIRLKLRADEEPPVEQEVRDGEALVRVAEEVYRGIVMEELHKTGGNTPTKIMSRVFRQR